MQFKFTFLKENILSAYVPHKAMAKSSPPDRPTLSWLRCVNCFSSVTATSDLPFSQIQREKSVQNESQSHLRQVATSLHG